MSKNLKIGLIGLLAVGLAVNGYFMWKKADDGHEAKQTKVVKKNEIEAGKSKADDQKFKTAPGAEKNYTIERSVDPVIEANDPATGITFAQMEHDFGSIEQNSENEHIFKFTNSGTNPLIIYKAKGSCGCTVPEFPKEPIAPGEEGEIRVVYKPGKQKNKQTKFVTVTANTEPKETKIKITADVQVNEE